jgi:hypothetical protein
LKILSKKKSKIDENAQGTTRGVANGGYVGVAQHLHHVLASFSGDDDMARTPPLATPPAVRHKILACKSSQRKSLNLSLSENKSNFSLAL